MPLPSFLYILVFFIRLCAVIWDCCKFRTSFGGYHGRDIQDDFFKPPRFLLCSYIFFLIAAVGMNALQIARLVKNGEGYGLLPVVIVGILLAFSTLRMRSMTMMALPYWILSTAFEALNVARLVKLNELHPAKDSLYPSSDKVVDNAVLLGIYFVFATIVTYTLIYMRSRTRTERKREPR